MRDTKVKLSCAYGMRLEWNARKNKFMARFYYSPTLNFYWIWLCKDSILFLLLWEGILYYESYTLHAVVMILCLFQNVFKRMCSGTQNKWYYLTQSGHISLASSHGFFNWLSDNLVWFCFFLIYISFQVFNRLLKYLCM